MDSVRRPFDSWSFSNNLKSAFSLSIRTSLDGKPSIKIDNFRIQSAVRSIENAFSPTYSTMEGYDRVIPAILRALIEELSADPQRDDYLSALVEFAQENASAVATLNYDTYFEDKASSLNIGIDRGLSEWNERRQVSWQKEQLKLMKLHGSVDWIDDDGNIALRRHEKTLFEKRLVIFGGQSEKLNPDGPFLQLRSSFERSLMLSNCLLVIGYSFADVHLNALVKSWVSTRSKGKLVVLDPGNIDFSRDIFRHSSRLFSGDIVKQTVEFSHIKRIASDGMEAALAEALKKPNLRERRRV